MNNSILCQLQSLRGDSIFVIAIKQAAKDNRLQDAIKEIIAQSCDNYNLVEKLIGKKLLNQIESLCCI